MVRHDTTVTALLLLVGGFRVNAGPVRRQGMGMSGSCATPYTGSCLDACGSYTESGGSFTWDNAYDACGNKAKLTSLTLRFLGNNVNDLDANRNALPVGPDGVQKQPDDKLEISSPGPGIRRVFVTSPDVSVSPGRVAVGETFTLSAPAGDTFPGDLDITLTGNGGRQWLVRFHASCSYALEVGDAYGSLQIVSHTNTLNCSSDDWTTTTPAPTTQSPTTPPTAAPTTAGTLLSTAGCFEILPSGCCQTATNGSGVFVESEQLTLASCQTACTGSPACVGYQFNAQTGMCRVYSNADAFVQTKPDQCSSVRCVQCTTISPTAATVAPTAAPTDPPLPPLTGGQDTTPVSATTNPSGAGLTDEDDPKNSSKANKSGSNALAFLCLLLLVLLGAGFIRRRRRSTAKDAADVVPNTSEPSVRHASRRVSRRYSSLVPVHSPFLPDDEMDSAEYLQPGEQVSDTSFGEVTESNMSTASTASTAANLGLADLIESAEPTKFGTMAPAPRATDADMAGAQLLPFAAGGVATVLRTAKRENNVTLPGQIEEECNSEDSGVPVSNSEGQWHEQNDGGNPDAISTQASAAHFDTNPRAEQKMTVAAAAASLFSAKRTRNTLSTDSPEKEHSSAEEPSNHASARSQDIDGSHRIGSVKRRNPLFGERQSTFFANRTSYLSGSPIGDSSTDNQPTPSDVAEHTPELHSKRWSGVAQRGMPSATVLFAATSESHDDDSISAYQENTCENPRMSLFGMPDPSHVDVALRVENDAAA